MSYAMLQLDLLAAALRILVARERECGNACAEFLPL
jgi:hypothetical protein